MFGLMSSSKGRRSAITPLVKRTHQEIRYSSIVMPTPRWSERRSSALCGNHRKLRINIIQLGASLAVPADHTDCTTGRVVMVPYTTLAAIVPSVGDSLELVLSIESCVYYWARRIFHPY
ncbi:hypothetical protein RvY_10566 [Ramazzottius varieornatus]|uniref:Uncharacterized protein n=1 Tax=Ramazzottius varieornatus TaxID=947166 RepID=A0A1D1VHP0_RAMVA|nr:hypothetical protein RvY_10566 [Ramazzottius varieornatus]